jgi:hypothetical protein
MDDTIRIWRLVGLFLVVSAPLLGGWVGAEIGRARPRAENLPGEDDFLVRVE